MRAYDPDLGEVTWDFDGAELLADGELQPGIEGLVHISEMSWTRNVRHPSKIVSIGETIEAVVLKVDETSNTRITFTKSAISQVIQQGATA